MEVERRMAEPKATWHQAEASLMPRWPARAAPDALKGLLCLLQVREELLEVEKRVAEMDGNSDSSTSDYARLKQVNLGSLPG